MRMPCLTSFDRLAAPWFGRAAAATASALMLTAPLPAAALGDGIDETMEAKCFIDPDAMMRQRLVYIGRHQACPGFDPIPLRYLMLPIDVGRRQLKDNSPACIHYLERSWRDMIGLARATGTIEDLCADARRARDGKP